MPASARHYLPVPVTPNESCRLSRGGAGGCESLLGSGDIQSLADLGNSYSVVKGMNITPVKKEDVLRLADATLVPILPLFLTMMSFENLLRKLLGILF